MLPELKWCRHRDSNPEPTDYKSVALPIELCRLCIYYTITPKIINRLKRLRATYTHGKGLSSVFVHRQYYHAILTYLGCKKHISKLTMRDKIHLIKHSNKLAESKKEKTLFRTQRQPVEAGAHGTLDYTIKKGVNKNRIADEKILKSKK